MSYPSSSDEVNLMRRIVARDQGALTELYDQFAPMVYGMAMRVLQNPSLAEEATQDTFMKIWRQADEWNPDRGKLITWMLTITKFTAIDRLRKEQRQPASGAIDLDEMLNLIGGTEPRQTLDRELIVKLIQRLPPEQIEAIDYAFFRGMSHSEIANALKLPLGTVKSRIRDGLQTLRRLWLQVAE